MKIVSFNVNGLRARLHQLAVILDSLQPDVVGLQEIKVSNEEFPEQAIIDMGYQVIYHGQKGHYGVALLYKCPLISSQLGFPQDAMDAQKRFIHGAFSQGESEVHVLNGYFPQGDSRDHPEKFPNKNRFYADLHDYIQNNFSSDDKIIVLGDMNVAPEDIDIGIGEDNKKRWLRTGKCCFLPEERQWLGNILNLGFVDSFRYLNPDKSIYSWYDYRSKGFDREPKRGLRIDLLLTNNALTPHLISGGIEVDARGMDKPSDHCPAWVELSI